MTTVVSRETMEGILGGVRWANWRRSTRNPLGAMLADILKPLPPRPPTFWLEAGEVIAPRRHDIVISLRGKGIDHLTLEDVGRPIRVTGQFKPNPYTRKLGTLTRLKVEFLDDKKEEKLALTIEQ